MRVACLYLLVTLIGACDGADEVADSKAFSSKNTVSMGLLANCFIANSPLAYEMFTSGSPSFDPIPENAEAYREEMNRLGEKFQTPYVESLVQITDSYSPAERELVRDYCLTRSSSEFRPILRLEREAIRISKEEK